MNEYIEQDKEFWSKTKINPPFPSDDEIKEVEHLFEDYIFFKDARTQRFLTTTCCGRKVEWPKLQRCMTVNDMAISSGKHNQKAVCPFCGREVTLKNIARSGKRKNLWEGKNILFLTAREGTLYALAASAWRRYEEPDEKTKWNFFDVFSFSPDKGTNEEYKVYASNMKTRQIAEAPGEYSFKNRRITEPFGYGDGHSPYHLVGYENKNKTFAKYCMFERFAPWSVQQKYTSEFIRYMRLFTAYPKLVEMLFKLDLEFYVTEAFYMRRKNAAILNWAAESPKEAFKLSGQEFRQMIELKADPAVMRIYQSLKKHGKYKIEFANELYRKLGSEVNLFLRLCKRINVTPRKALNYISKSTGSQNVWHYSQALKLWEDYINACSYLGYDLDAVKMPKDLRLKHNEAAAEQQRMLELEKAKKDKAALKKFRASLKKREKKYNFSYGGYTIRVARSREEILSEGKILSHCVGGYAARHIDNKLTILFLRPDDKPGTPYVTVEMHGNTLIQAHGFRNECDGAEAPKSKHKDFFEKWLTWIEAGSKRDEAGKPIIQKTKRKKVA